MSTLVLVQGLNDPVSVLLLWPPLLTCTGDYYFLFFNFPHSERPAVNVVSSGRFQLALDGVLTRGPPHVVLTRPADLVVHPSVHNFSPSRRTIWTFNQKVSGLFRSHVQSVFLWVLEGSRCCICELKIIKGIHIRSIDVFRVKTSPFAVEETK